MKFSRIITFFAVSAILFNAPSFAASGLDSDGFELPLNAKEINVATLKSTGVPGSGIFEVAGLLDAKSMVLANAGAKIGKIDKACSEDLEGAIRYYKDASTRELQYCNGTVWSAALQSDKKNCPATKFSYPCTTGTCYVNLPSGGHLQIINTAPPNRSDIHSYQCYDGAWADTGTVSITVY